MYDAESIRLFAAVKAICDPDNLLNPGNLVDPAPLDADLRPVRPRLPVHAAAPAARTTAAASATPCTAAPASASASPPSTSGVMCPSYLATRDEKDSTRGRARVLQEAIDGDAGRRASPTRPSPRRSTSAWPARAARRTARPAWTWRPTRPRRCTRSTTSRAYAARAATGCWAGCRRGPTAPRRWPPLANRLMRLGPVARLAKATAGIDQRRSIPAFAPTTLRRSVPHGRATRPDVWIWADSFSDHFFPGNGHAAIRYLESVGPDRPGDPRRRLLRADLDHHRPARPGAARSWRARSRRCAPYVDSGVPVIGLEPSCLATLRSDAAELDRRPSSTCSASPSWSSATRAAGARPHRRRGGRPAALPPPRGDRLGRRPGAAGAGRRHGHPGRRLLRPGRQLRHGEGPLRGLGRGGRDPPAAGRARATRAPWSSPTACPAGSSSTTWPACRPCTWPSCWRQALR